MNKITTKHKLFHVKLIKNYRLMYNFFLIKTNEGNTNYIYLNDFICHHSLFIP